MNRYSSLFWSYEFGSNFVCLLRFHDSTAALVSKTLILEEVHKFLFTAINNLHAGVAAE